MIEGWVMSGTSPDALERFHFQAKHSITVDEAIAVQFAACLGDTFDVAGRFGGARDILDS
jgi:hypothetical protein